MSRKRLTTILVTVAAILLSGTLWAGEEQSEADQPEMSPEALAEMEAWMKLAQPGEHHQHLAPFAGKWKAQIKMWMAPDSEPMINESAAEANWVKGGRFLEWTHTGTFAGMPYEGYGIDGYNNGENRYETIWLDNFGTLMMFYTGECSDDGKSRIMSGEFTSPTDSGTIQQKLVFTWIDEDHFTFESHMKQGDVEYKSMEMVYERQ